MRLNIEIELGLPEWQQIQAILETALRNGAMRYYGPLNDICLLIGAQIRNKVLSVDAKVLNVTFPFETVRVTET